MGLCLNRCSSKTIIYGEATLDNDLKLSVLSTLQEKQLQSNLLQSALRGYFLRKSLIFKDTRILGKIPKKKLGLTWISSHSFSDGIYTGQSLKSNTRVGLGELLLHNGGSYYGYFKNNLYHGMGKLCENQRIFEGEWVSGKKHGYGELKSEVFDYFGYWKHGVYDGKGKEVWKGHCVYEGDFINGKKQGVGRCEFGNQDYYTGEFFDNKFHGIGEFRWNGRKVYKGEWKNGKMHGKGSIIWDSGRVYRGSFKKGKMHGSGERTNNGIVRTYLWNKGKKTAYEDA